MNTSVMSICKKPMIATIIISIIIMVIGIIVNGFSVSNLLRSGSGIVSSVACLFLICAVQLCVQYTF